MPSRARTKPWNSYLHRKNIVILEYCQRYHPKPKKRFICPSKSAPYTRKIIVYHNLAFTFSKKKHFNYVLLSQFSTDPIEKGFNKLMQCSGRAYFVNVRSIFDKLALKKSQLYLIFNKCEDQDSCDVDYSCEKFHFVSNEHICEMIDNLECIHEQDLSFESLADIVYVAGNVIRRDP